MAKKKKSNITIKLSKKVSLIILVGLLIIVSISAGFTKFINNNSDKWLFNYFNVVRAKDNLLVHFISVGQGDSIAVNLPDDKVMVIDSGPSSSANSLVSYLQEKVLNTHKDNYINYLVLTHSDADHIGGALNILKNFKVGYVFMPVVESDGTTYENLVDYINNNNIQNGTDYSLLNYDNGYKIEVFGPLERSSVTSSDLSIIKNSLCPVIKLSYNNKSFLFTGDIPADAYQNPFNAEQAFVDLYGTQLDSDILKVAHHGSKYSSSLAFLQAVTPEYAVISVGKNNYGHPGADVLARLEGMGAEIYRTDKLGSVLFVMSDDYGLQEIDGNYKITDFTFNFLYIVLIIDAGLLVLIVIVAATKSKR